MSDPNTPKSQPLVEQTFGEKLETWYDRNGIWINVIIVGALVAVIGYKGYQWIHDRNVAKANAAFATALNVYQGAVRNPDQAKKIEELQGAVTAAEQVVADYSDRFAGRQAQLIIGNAHYTIALAQPGKQVEHLERAQEAYTKYVSLAQTDEEKAAGHLALGNVQENLGFDREKKDVLQEAVASYTKAADLGKGTRLEGEGKLAAALVNTAINDEAAQSAAKKLYAEVAENRPVQLVSDESLEAAKAIKLESGATLSEEKVKDIKNLAAWSQQQEAKDALSQGK